MTHTVHQHWDPLKVCAVGRSFPPEFYRKIDNPKVRSVMERIAIETEEDYQKLIKILEKFNVKVLRTDVSDNVEDYVNCNSQGIVDSPPPMCPRDHSIMIGDTFYMPGSDYATNYSVDETMSAVIHHIQQYSDSKTCKMAKVILNSIDPDNTMSDKGALMKMRNKFKQGSLWHHTKALVNVDDLRELIIQSHTQTIGSNIKFPNNKKVYAWESIRKWCNENKVPVKYDQYLSGATTFRVGKDLMFGNVNMIDGMFIDSYKKKWAELFPDYRRHTENVASHIDGLFHPVKPGLIITSAPKERFKESFPDWEVVKVSQKESWQNIDGFLEIKRKNKGRWWIPGEENNEDLYDFIENWLNHWVTYVEETVFDVNMFVIDQKNVIVNGYNEKVYDAFERHGITPHPLPLRHRFFWDGGLHCITTDMSREGEQVDYFPERNV
tara:strand:+ start:167 stop:1477 length:1311 start_codon:yes stop_codon:yes gene_type:complete